MSTGVFIPTKCLHLKQHSTFDLRTGTFIHTCDECGHTETDTSGIKLVDSDRREIHYDRSK